MPRLLPSLDASMRTWTVPPLATFLKCRDTSLAEAEYGSCPTKSVHATFAPPVDCAGAAASSFASGASPSSGASVGSGSAAAVTAAVALFFRLVLLPPSAGAPSGCAAGSSSTLFLLTGGCSACPALRARS